VEWRGRRQRHLRERVYFIGTYCGHGDVGDEQAIETGDDGGGNVAAAGQTTKGTGHKKTRNEKGK
jgi:hypothetical protein